MKSKRSSLKAILLVVFMVLGGLQLDVSVLEAQACREDCSFCGFFKHQGAGEEGLPYSTECPVEETTSCEFCLEPSPLVRADAPTDAEVLRAVQTVDIEDLGAVVKKYGDYLLLHPGRGVLVVRGTVCHPDALGSTVFLSRARTVALARLGTRSLEDFLAR